MNVFFLPAKLGVRRARPVDVVILQATQLNENKCINPLMSTLHTNAQMHKKNDPSVAERQAKNMSVSARLCTCPRADRFSCQVRASCQPLPH